VAQQPLRMPSAASASRVACLWRTSHAHSALSSARRSFLCVSGSWARLFFAGGPPWAAVLDVRRAGEGVCLVGWREPACSCFFLQPGSCRAEVCVRVYVFIGVWQAACGHSTCFYGGAGASMLQVWCAPTCCTGVLLHHALSFKQPNTSNLHSCMLVVKRRAAQAGFLCGSPLQPT
jgi:hypothetical protein